MAAFDIYILVLCLIVFTALTAFFAILIVSLFKARLKMIRGGLADSEILSKQQEKAKPKKLAASFILDRVISLLFCIIIVIIFGFSLSVRFTETSKVGSTPIVKVVRSGSMATKYEKNTYLDENGLTDRIKKFDLIVVNQLPKEEDLKLYDIVVYEADGYLIVHRIVGIVEPDETHATRQFLLQGDANQYPDRFPVYYSQMRGIYTGTRIPFIGSFVDFMHSPAGYLCFLLIIFVCVMSPLIEKKVISEIEKREKIISFHRLGVSFSYGYFSKALVRDFMLEQHKEELYVRKGKDFTRTGLSVPDTYYALIEGRKKCFAYVYCTKKGGTMIRFICNETQKEELDLSLEKSSFPKSKENQWYVMKIPHVTDKESCLIARVLESAFLSLKEAQGGMTE